MGYQPRVRTDAMDASRRYTEAEITAILKQAVPNQEQARSDASYDGLTLAEIKEAGQAAGIAPECIGRAAAVDAAALTPPGYTGRARTNYPAGGPSARSR